MKMKKLAAVMAAMATTAMMAVNVSAADWSQVSYADNDSGTGRVVSFDENGFEFANTEVNADICKARITLEKVLKNPADFDKVRKLSWTVTYNNVPDNFTGESLSGGTYVTCTNSVGYTIDADDWDEATDTPVWNKGTYTIEDTCDLADDITLVENGELVFMDWSYANLGDFGITVTITDFKMFDKDGNEIEQLGLNEFGTVVEEAEPVEETGEAAETTAATETNTEENETTTDNTETVKSEIPKTGNSMLPISVAVAAAVISFVALTLKKKK